jgi:hypothetical protein
MQILANRVVGIQHWDHRAMVSARNRRIFPSRYHLAILLDAFQASGLVEARRKPGPENPA